MSGRRLTRRSLLKGAAVGVVAAPGVIPGSALGNDAKAAPSERVTLGHIGVGSRGRCLLRGFLRNKEAQCVAAADAYKSRREAAAAMIKGKAYTDFREILARDDVDAVVVATPDHLHVPIANAAARAGKDAYVEKPLGVTIEEDLLCRKLFRQHKRIFQYGTQQRQIDHCRFGCELVRSGRIGEVHTIEVTLPNGGAGGSTKPIPVPADLDYNTWVGPAPMRPYTADRCIPRGTYWIYDYSIGYLSGWGAHALDIMVLGSDADISGPVVLEGTGVIPTEGLYDTVYNWDIKGKLGKVDFTLKVGANATKFIGPDGWVQIFRPKIDAEPKSLLQSKIGPDDIDGWLNVRSQSGNFIDSIKSRHDPVSPIDQAVRSDVISLLCDIAVRIGRKITWDPQKELIVGDDQAAKMAKARPMREPWTL